MWHVHSAPVSTAAFLILWLCSIPFRNGKIGWAQRSILRRETRRLAEAPQAEYLDNRFRSFSEPAAAVGFCAQSLTVIPL
jgi:hypothetical protein